MNKLLLCSLLLTLSSVLINCQGDLVFTAISFRHGHRAPQVPQFNLNLDKWPRLGELTAVGVRQAFLLGQELRYRYFTQKGFYPSTYDAQAIAIESTDYNRTIMTALSVAAGIFPPGTGPQLPENYQAERAVPPFNLTGVNYSNFGNNSIIYQVQPMPIFQAPNLNCLVFFQSIAKAPQVYAAKIANLSQKFSMVVSQLNTYYNVSNITIYDLQFLYDTWISDYFNNHSLPNSNLTSDFWKNFTKLDDFLMYTFYAGNEEANKLIATYFFNKVRGWLGAKIAGKVNQKLSLFGTHDNVLASVLAATKQTSNDCLYNYIMNDTDYTGKCFGHPPFISQMIYELYNNSGSYTVKLKYNDRDLSPCNNGQLSCTWAEFNTFIDSITYPFAEIDLKCGNIPAPTTPTTNTSSNSARPQYVVLFSLVLAMLLIFV